MITYNKSLPQTALIPSSDYVIFGGTGDLSLRKILPALLWRFYNKQVTSDFRIFIVSRNPPEKSQFIDLLHPFCKTALDEFENAETVWQGFLDLLQIVSVDLQSGEGMDDLSKIIMSQQNEARPVIFYMAISPELFGKCCQWMDETGLVLPQSRLVVEKPLGSDYQSAKSINDQILSVFEEYQIYRIDHYLGKETVQNLMALRFANVIFENQWSNRYIDHVQITVAEQVDVDNRAAYYDHYGALRDMVQNHLLQLLCLVAMEPPARFNADEVRDEKLRVLRALRPCEAGNVQRGQYEGYEDALGKASNTETYVALKCFIDNWRWSGVPFYLRTGKKLETRASEIVITFRQQKHMIFDTQTDTPPNRLIIRLQPHEGLRFQLISKAPGPGGMRLYPSDLNLSFDDTFDERLPEAYERLLMDVARGNQTLFMRLDEVLAAWSFIDPIIAMAADSKPDLYPAFSMGPEDQLMKNDAYGWVDPHEVV